MFLISPRTLRYGTGAAERRERTTTTRRDENDDHENDDDDLTRLLSGPVCLVV
jgi:hypothetical protein